MGTYALKDIVPRHPTICNFNGFSVPSSSYISIQLPVAKIIYTNQYLGIKLEIIKNYN